VDVNQIINKFLTIMKTYLTILLSLLLLPVIGFAAYNDVVMSSGGVISVGGYSLAISGTANFDSITVNSDNFTIDLSKNATLTVTSSDRRSYTTSPTAYVQSFTCGSDSSTMTLGNNVWDQTITVTVTPSSSACSATGGGGIVGGGGGGGGGGGSVPTPVQTTIPGTQTAQAVAQPSAVAQIVSPVFNATLRYGMTSADVTRLQQLLAQDKEIYPEGIVSGWFGQLTKKAVQKFQEKYGIESVGIVGPQTRAKLNEVFAQTTTPTTPTAPTIQPSALTLTLRMGTTNNEVKTLQELLAKDKEIYPEGLTTGYFGNLTRKAVQKFQEKYGIVSSGDENTTGYGLVGPKTRAKILEVLGQ